MKDKQEERINNSRQKCKVCIISEALSETGFNFVLLGGACPSRLSLPLYSRSVWAEGRQHHGSLLLLSHTTHPDILKSAYLTVRTVLLMEAYCLATVPLLPAICSSWAHGSDALWNQGQQTQTNVLAVFGRVCWQLVQSGLQMEVCPVTLNGGWFEIMVTVLRYMIDTVSVYPHPPHINT